MPQLDPADVHRALDPVGHRDRRDLVDRPPALEHELGHEGLEVVEDEDVGPPARRDRAEVVEAVVGGRVERRHHDRVLRRQAERDGIADDRVDVPVVGDVLRLAVVGAERHPVRPVLERERQRARARLRALEASRISSQSPARRRSRPSSSGRRLVVGLDPRRRVGVERLAGETGRVAVDVLREARASRAPSSAPETTPGKFIISASPSTCVRRRSPSRSPGRELAARRLEARRGHARRGHEVDVERQLRGLVEQPVHAVGAEHVRDLVRVGDDRGRAERQHEPGELVDQELRRLDVQVRVDEPGDEVAPGGVDRLDALVGAEPGDDAVDDRDVGLEPLAGEDAEDTAAADHEVGRLVASRDRESSSEIDRRHARMIAVVGVWLALSPDGPDFLMRIGSSDG